MDTVKVNILEKEYQVACPPEQKDALVRSARNLDHRMREIRASGKVLGLDRIAVMAALNLSHDLLTEQEQTSEMGAQVERRVSQMSERIDQALTDLRQLKL